MGDFLKELDLTEGKATGIPTIARAMEANGSPSVQYDTDEARSFFHVTIPIHPDFSPLVKEVKPSTKVQKKSTVSSEEIKEEFGRKLRKIQDAFLRKFINVTSGCIPKRPGNRV